LTFFLTRSRGRVSHRLFPNHHRPFPTPRRIMPATGHVHTTDPVYAPPVLRAPSPTGSLSTEYGPDEGGLENELSDEIFAKLCEEKIGFQQKSVEQESIAFQVILPKPRGKDEELDLHHQVLENLRRKVREVEEEELYEGNVLHKLSPAVEEQPASNDIDAIMRSMLGPSPNQSNATATQPQDNSIMSFGGFQTLNGRK